MQMRGCVKRHTVGCTEDLSLSNQSGAGEQHIVLSGGGQTSSGIRTRRSGLLTVTERPPGKFPFFSLIYKVQ